jgi:hypothetical protein
MNYAGCGRLGTLWRDVFIAADFINGCSNGRRGRGGAPGAMVDWGENSLRMNPGWQGRTG